MEENGSYLDEIDQALLNALQQDARLSNAELARRVDLSPSGLQKRLRRLESQGMVQNYRAILDRQQIGYTMLCFVHITLRRHKTENIETFRAAIQTVPEVLECFHLTGMDDYLLKVVVRDVEHLEHFLRVTLTPLHAIDKIRTSIVLRELKSTTALPIPVSNDR